MRIPAAEGLAEEVSYISRGDSLSKNAGSIVVRSGNPETAPAGRWAILPHSGRQGKKKVALQEIFVVL